MPCAFPKDGYFAHQVMWDGWVDVERPRIHIIGHWNYEPDTKKDVYVVSSADQVELFLNGQSLGFGIQSSRFLYTFKDVEWQAGTLKAVGSDIAGKKICETETKTAGKPDSIRLSVFTGPVGLRADGHDLAMVEVEVIDQAGARCPTALNPIDFALSGPAEWRGGIAQGPDNYILSKSLPVECGVNRVLVRSLPTAGKITLKATADGLKPAAVEIISQPVKVTDGLCLVMPDAGLPSFLQRGPTPSTTPLQMTRSPIHILSATAGANIDQTSKSYDDNETTGWSNDGQRSTAWVEYQFDHPVPISEVTLKLGDWRQRSYPLRISVDGQEAFTGTTPRSLGYVTLPLKPTTGKSLKVELTGQAGGQDAFNITELAAQKDDKAVGSGQGEGKGTLNIIEIEIYGPAASGPKRGITLR